MGFLRRQLLIYVAIGIVVVAIGARYLLAGQGPDEDVAASGVPLDALATSPEAAAAGQEGIAASPSPTAAPEVVVDVVGAVVSPGVYRLPADARVCDAVDMAGGATSTAELAGVNMAARLTDGQQIVVPEQGTAGAASATAGTGTAASAASGAPVSLNTATLEQLDALSGVGPSTAQKIIDYREEHGGFKSVDELKEVPGIGDAKFASLKDQVVL